jgi:mannitol-specific phosphotransferase system IIBC component
MLGIDKMDQKYISIIVYVIVSLVTVFILGYLLYDCKKEKEHLLYDCKQEIEKKEKEQDQEKDEKSQEEKEKEQEQKKEKFCSACTPMGA